MFNFMGATSNNSEKDANTFAPSCSCASKNSETDFLSGIALAMSVFLSVLCIDLCVIPVLSVLLIKASTAKRKKHSVVEL